MGSMVASFLCGATDRIFELSKKEMDDVIYSSKKQKELFISSFMKIACGISTGDDRFKVVYKSEYIISFVRRIFWSMGYYCVMDGDEMCIRDRHITIVSFIFSGYITLDFRIDLDSSVITPHLISSNTDKSCGSF